jgi:hypothetical protein
MNIKQILELRIRKMMTCYTLEDNDGLYLVIHINPMYVFAT